MEKQTEQCGSLRSYLLRKVQHCSVPFFPSPSHLLQQSASHNFRDSISQNHSDCNSLFTLPAVNVWSKLWTVARCSTSLNPADTRQGPFSAISNKGDGRESGEGLEDCLPGVQGRRGQSRLRNRNSLANDMQVNQLIEQETGLQRLQAMYSLRSDWMFVQEDTRTITTMFYRSVLLGFLLNVVKAAQSGTRPKKNLSASQAVMKVEMNALGDSRRILRDAVKGSLRLAAFAASLLYLSQSLAAYRNQSSIWEYSISTAVAMAMVGLGKPPVPFVINIAGGALIGALGGSFVCSMLSSAGASQEQRTLNRIREALEQEQRSEVETVQ